MLTAAGSASLLMSAALSLAQAAPKAPGAWPGTEGHLAQLERALSGRSEDLTPLAWLHERASWTAEDTDPRRWRQLLTRVASDRNAHPLVKDHASWLLLQVALDQQDAAQATPLADRLGLVRTFQVVGPFENTGGASFTEPSPVDTVTSLDGRFDGLSREVTWHRVEDVGPAAALNLHDHLWPAEDVLAHALVFVNSTTEQDVAVRVGASDQVEVRVNGARLLQANEMHAAAPDQHSVAVHLRAGWNRIHCRVGQLRGAWRLILRVTAPQGGVAPGITFSSDPAVAAQAFAAPAVAATAAVADPVALLEARAAAARPDDAEPWMDAFVLRQHLAVDDERTTPPARTAHLRKALQAKPNHARALTALAQLELSSDANQARAHLEAAVGVDPGHAPAWLALGLLRSRQELPVDARRALERAVAADGAYTQAAVALWDEVAAQGPDAEAALVGMAGVARRRPSLAALDGLMRMQQTRGQVRAALATANRIRQGVPAHRGARAVVMDVARREQDAAPLERELRLELAWAPHHAQRVEDLAQLLCNTQRCPEGVTLLARFRAAHPDAWEVALAHAETLLRTGQKDAAAEALARVLDLRPQEGAVRRRLEMLSSAERFEARHVLNLKALSSEAPPPGADEAGAYAMGHLVAHRLHGNGLTTSVVDQTYRLLSRTKASLLQSLVAGYVPSRETLDVLVAERIRPDGSVVPASVDEQDPSGRQMGVYTDTRRVTVDFGVPEPGDIIRFRYRVDAVGERNLFGDFFGATESAQEALPKAHFTLVVEAPESRPLSWKVARLPEPTVSRNSGTVVHRLEAGPLPALVVEPNMPPYTEVGAYAVFSSYARWEDMGRWYAALVREQLVPDAALRAVAHAVVEGARDDAEKVQRIHRHVLERTRYVGIELGIHGWKPYRVGQVHSRGYGDCKDKASLMVAMFREVGVDARLVLLRTFDQGPLVDIPTMWAFNHAIAYVPSLDLYLDGTAEFSGPAELPFMDQQAMALLVDVQTGAVQRASPPLVASRTNLNESSYTIRLDAQGGMALEGQEAFAGQRAPEERARLQEPGTQQATLERDFSSLYPGATVEDVKVSSPRALDVPLTYAFRASVPAFGQPDGPVLRVPITLYPHELAREYAPTATRRHDVVLNFPFITRNRMRFVLPQGATVEDLPSSGTVSSPHFEFTQTITGQADGYVVEEVAHLKSRRIPAADYPRFRQALLEADRRMRVPVVLRVPAAPATAARRP